MKVTCQSCQAKYTIADEKVRGKVAKIRCKKCGTTIIVDGTDGAVANPSEHPVADYTQQGANADQWTVLVGEGDQRTVSAGDLTKLYVSGDITYETPAWKDGMPEWLPISQIDALRSVLDNGPQPTMMPFADQAPQTAAQSEPPPPEPVVQAPPMFNVAAAAPAAKPIGARPRAAEPAAARRAGRGASTDLFGAPAQDEVLTSASANPVMHAGEGGHDKLTGERNENSVLFSLSSLTGAPGGAASAAAPATFDAGPASGRADLRALVSSDSNGRPTPARSGLDDIMNLGGGGVYSPGLMAPALAPPPIDFASAADSTEPIGKPKSKAMLFAIVGVLVVGGAAAFFAMSGKDSSKTDAVASAAPSATPAPIGLGARAPEPTASAAAPEPTATSAPTVLAPGQAAPKPEAKAVKATTPAAAAAAAPAAVPAAAPDKPAAAAPAAAPAAAAGGDFDRAAALSALSAAASASQSCRKADGPTGSGKIAVTFANNGAATTAAVEGPPFAGTPVGGCVAARFRGVHVPPFGGATVTVHKTFIIN